MRVWAGEVSKRLTFPGSGGRTAWSCRVEVNGELINARFWFDGKNLENAKEDAAEIALNRLNSTRSPTSSTSRGSIW